MTRPPTIRAVEPDGLELSRRRSRTAYDRGVFGVVVNDVASRTSADRHRGYIRLRERRRPIPLSSRTLDNGLRVVVSPTRVSAWSR
ncbi:MAG: hypothetical protein WKF73_03340 [Nocardioidaceae bacterium]